MTTKTQLVEARRAAWEVAKSVVPAPFMPERLSYFAPNFRCSGDDVEVPEGWARMYAWDGSDAIRHQIADLLRVYGRTAVTFEGRGSRKGWRVPIDRWDAIFQRYVGVSGPLDIVANAPHVDFAAANQIIDAAYAKI